jgi:uncharacterized protein (DUF1697 family)
LPRYAAFLRGINLARHRRVSNADLRAVFEKASFDNVATLRASGNVVFDAPGRQPSAKLTARVEEALAAGLGFDVQVFLRTAQEVQAIAAFEPFAPELVEASKGKLQVDLLTKAPPANVREQVLALATDSDQLAFGDREVYWLPSGGTLESTLDLRAIEKLVGRTTRRTMGTMQQLAAKYLG